MHCRQWTGSHVEDSMYMLQPCKSTSWLVEWSGLMYCHVLPSQMTQEFDETIDIYYYLWMKPTRTIHSMVKGWWRITSVRWGWWSSAKSATEGGETWGASENGKQDREMVDPQYGGFCGVEIFLCRALWRLGGPPQIHDVIFPCSCTNGLFQEGSTTWVNFKRRMRRNTLEC